jgi:hypothetical protein
MKDLTKQKNIYSVFRYKQFPVITKEIFIYLLILFILVFYYYICMYTCTYNFNNYNDELTTIYTISFEEFKPVNQNQSNIWYKYLLDDFFNTFTSNSKTINPKILEVKSDVKTLMPLELEHNISTVKKSVILNKIQSDSIKSIILECEFYKDKASLLEIQLLQTKIAYHNLIKDIDDITKEMPYSLKKS